MNPEAVEITQHALMRFITRHTNNLPSDAKASLRTMLAKAEPEDIGPVGRAMRLMGNGFEPAKYFTFGNWRFVTTEDETKLLTCELIYRKAHRERKKAKRR